MRLEPYGAFVRLAPGLEGLVHVSELAPGRRIAHPREVVELGQDVEARVLRVEPEKRRISLALAAPAETREATAVEEYEGRAEAASGFGAMADFFDQAKKE
jgi:ribosomal protein S1